MFTIEGSLGVARFAEVELARLEAAVRRWAMANIPVIDAELSAQNVGALSDSEKADIIVTHLRPRQRVEVRRRAGR